MTLDEELKRCRKTAHIWLLFYDEKQQEMVESYVSTLHSTYTPDPNSPGPSSKTADPVSTKASKLVSIGRQAELLALIDEYYNSLSLGERVYINLRRLYRRQPQKYGWVKPVKQGYAAEMARITEKPESEFVLTGTNMARMWKKFVNDIAVLAARRNLL